MTRSETAGVLMVLHAAYPQFYRNMSDEEINEVLNLWADIFSDVSLDVVRFALKRLICTHAGYPPTIADVIQKIEELKAVVNAEPTNEELWLILREGITDGQNGAEQHFEKFPLVLKRFCGKASWLRDHASQDISTIDTIVKGQFMKSISEMRSRTEYESSLPDSLKGALRDVYSGKRLTEKSNNRVAVQRYLNGGTL